MMMDWLPTIGSPMKFHGDVDLDLYWNWQWLQFPWHIHHLPLVPLASVLRGYKTLDIYFHSFVEEWVLISYICFMKSKVTCYRR